MRRETILAAFIVGVCCALGAPYSQGDTMPADSAKVRINHFIPLRNEIDAPTMEKLTTNRFYKEDYNRTVLQGKIRSFYVVDTVHIHSYYILEDKNNISFLIADKNGIGKDFNYDNPLANRGCYLTNGWLGAPTWVWDYFCGPVARSLEPFWPYYYYPISKKKMPHGYNLYGLYKGGQDIYIHKNDTIPYCTIPHIFAVFLIKGSVYNHYFIGIMDYGKDVPFNFPDENSYYTLLIPIYDEKIYKFYFDRILYGNYNYYWGR